jgi:hypothetical protein
MKKFYAALVALGLFFKINAQDLEIKWSEQFIYDNKADGFFDYYIGTNKDFIYAKFSNLALNFNTADSKIKIIAFDKKTMEKRGETRLLGYGKDTQKKGMDYYKTLILDDVIYVLWTKELKGLVEIYAQSFDNKLNSVNDLKKVYEINVSKKATDNLVIEFNKNVGNKILLGKEFATTEDGEKLRFEYRLINQDFSLSSSKQVTLPVIITRKRRRDASYTNPVCEYQLADDGNIYAQDVVRLSSEERKSLKKGEAYVYPIIMQVKPESGDVSDYRLKFPRKNTFNFSSLISSDGNIKLYGFFSDLEKDEKGNDTHGTFFINVNNKNFEPTATKFSYFDKNFLDQLYAADKENQKKGSGLFKGKKAKESDAESIDDNYVIENVVYDGRDILLFCSIMRNWERTVCTTNSNGASSCRTYYYCTKSNVTTFRLNSQGEIIQARNLDRSVTYSRWNVYDMTVVKGGSNYYIVYGSDYQVLASKKNNRNKKSRKQQTDRFEYAVFDATTGQFRKAEHQVNGFNTKKKDAKYVSAANISLFDNKMYTSCSNTKLKPTTWISCLCPPVFYFLSYSGNARKGTGYLGTINPLK